MGGKARSAKRPSQQMELFGRCACGQRARLVYLDERNRPCEEPYVRRFIAAHLSVYQVTCPTCGTEYTMSDASVERVGVGGRC